MQAVSAWRKRPIQGFGRDAGQWASSNPFAKSRWCRTVGQSFPANSRYKTLQLRVIAFAVSSICKFPRIYVDFEKQWSHTTSYRISTCSIPKYRTKFYEYAKSLYPEVDFSPLESSCGIETFYTPQSPEDITKMYNELINTSILLLIQRSMSLMGFLTKRSL